MNGFKVGDRVSVTSFMGRDVKQPVTGVIVEFAEKFLPRDTPYLGNEHTHWVVVKIDTFRNQIPFSVRVGEEWPAQFDEIQKIEEESPSSNFHVEGDPSRGL